MCLGGLQSTIIVFSGMNTDGSSRHNFSKGFRYTTSPIFLEKESKESGLDSIIYLEEMTLVPEALRTDNKFDYKNISAMYKQY